jgi:hypothetical protein
VSLDTIGSQAAQAAHQVARSSDPDAALGAVIDRSHRRDRVRRVAGGVAIVALLAGIGIAIPFLRAAEEEAASISALPDTNLQIPIVVGLPDGFRVVRDEPWSLGIDAREDLSAQQPWAGMSIDRPDGVIDPDTLDILPLPEDLAEWVRSDPTIDILAERTVEVAGQQALQWDVQPKSIQSAPCFTVDGEPVDCGNSLTRFRFTLLYIDGMPVFVSGGVPQPFWPLPEPDTPGDAYDAFLGSIHVR